MFYNTWNNKYFLKSTGALVWAKFFPFEISDLYALVEGTGLFSEKHKQR